MRQKLGATSSIPMLGTTTAQTRLQMSILLQSRSGKAPGAARGSAASSRPTAGGLSLAWPAQLRPGRQPPCTIASKPGGQSAYIRPLAASSKWMGFDCTTSSAGKGIHSLDPWRWHYDPGLHGQRPRRSAGIPLSGHCDRSPGYGYSTRPRRLWTPDAHARLFKNALAKLGVERAIVLGHSWGTLVALALALEYPPLVRNLVLASGYYYPTLRADTFLLSPPAIPVLGDAMRHTISPFIARLFSRAW